MLSFHKKKVIFAQGDSTDGLFFIQENYGSALHRTSGRSSALGILGEGDFFGRWSCWLFVRMSSAIATTPAYSGIEKKAMMRHEPGTKCRPCQVLAEAKYRYQDDLIDQLSTQ
jgi:hypothetical protein